MQAFMWQDDLIGVAKFVNACVTSSDGWKAHESRYVQTAVVLETLNSGKREEMALKREVTVGCVA